MELTLPSDKVERIRSQCRDLLELTKVPLIELTKLLGKLTSTAIAILPAPLHYRQLQRSHIKQLLKSNSYSRTIVLSKEAKQELTWWMNNLHLCNGKSLLKISPDLTIALDASMKGWGASCQGRSTGGPWSKEESKLHINILELKAAQLAIETFTQARGITSIHLQMDNMTALSYIAKMGGTKNSQLIAITQEIWNYLIKKRT